MVALEPPRSIETGAPFLRGNTAAMGLVPNKARLPPHAGMAEGELPKARPTMPACANWCSRRSA